MRVMNCFGMRIYTVVGNTRECLPSGGVAFFHYLCDFCNEESICLVNDSTNGEYTPASICKGCIDRLYAQRDFNN